MLPPCETQEEIAETVGVHKDTISELCRKIPDLEKSDKVAATVDCTHPTVKTITDGFVSSVLENQTYKAAASHATDFVANGQVAVSDKAGTPEYTRAHLRYVAGLLDAGGNCRGGRDI